MLNTQIVLHGDYRQLRFARMGNGEAVIMLHGYPENLQVFSAIGPQLAKDHEVIAFDWPGIGYSEDIKGGTTPVAMAKKLLTLMDEWGIVKAHLVAQDMGGQPALVFAAQYPERVISVTVMNALVAGDIETSWEIKWLRRFGINSLLMRYFPKVVFWRAIQTFVPGGYKMENDLQNDMWQAFRTPPVREFIIRMCAGYEAQLKRLPHYYKQIKCPVLILWGEADKHFPPAQAHQLKEYIPHAQIIILPSATHWMVLADANKVVNRINEFYTSLNS